MTHPREAAALPSDLSRLRPASVTTISRAASPASLDSSPASTRLLYLAWALTVGLYLLRTYFFAYEDVYGPIIHAIFKGERSLLDRAEAVLWLPVVALNATMIAMAWRRELPWLTRLWFVGLALACFVMAGEEISWGQHVIGFAPPEAIRDVNAQEEFNFHNLNLGILLGVPPTHWLYPRLTNFNFILNPAYYLFSIVIWIVIPRLRARRMESWLRTIPTPTAGISVFLGVNVVAYLLADNLVFNAGEIFEFALVSTYALATVEIFRRFRATGDPRRAAEGTR